MWGEINLDTKINTVKFPIKFTVRPYVIIPYDVNYTGGLTIGSIISTDISQSNSEQATFITEKENILGAIRYYAIGKISS